MNKNLICLAFLAVSALSSFAHAGDLDGMQISAALSSSSTESVSSTADDKIITIGFGYSQPITQDGQIVLGGQIDSTVHFGSNSNQAINLGGSIQPGYYVNDNVLVYGKIGVLQTTQNSIKKSGSTFGVGIKYKVSQSAYMGGEIEQVKVGDTRETKVSGKVGYLFE